MNDKSKLVERRSWYMYDFAVSAFTTTVITVFLGPYLTTIAKNAADADGFLDIFGIPVFHGSFFTYCVSLSVILQVFLLPVLGAIADTSNYKKKLLIFSAYLGSIAAMLLYFLEDTNYLYGGALLIISNLAFGASMIFYNAFLSDIANEDERDKVSSLGFAWGYFGGGILLAINLVLVMQAENFGLTMGHAVRISLASAGLWWAIFTIFPAIHLKVRVSKVLPKDTNIVSYGFKAIIQTIKDARKYPKTLLFLLAYLLYNDGVQAVIVVSSQFGQEELGLDISTLTTVILMVQFVAFFGAIFFNKLAEWFDSKKALLFSLVIWIGIVFYAYMFLNSTLGFYILGAVIAIVLGGTQALSRSLFSLLIPKGKEAEYFSLYEISERGTSWIGPLVFGMSLQFTGSYRIAIFSLGIFFLFGALLLLKINMKKAILESGNQLPANLMRN
jgi:UMF1 family MFS transporter